MERKRKKVGYFQTIENVSLIMFKSRKNKIVVRYFPFKDRNGEREIRAFKRPSGGYCQADFAKIMLSLEIGFWASLFCRIITFFADRIMKRNSQKLLLSLAKKSRKNLEIIYGINGRVDFAKFPVNQKYEWKNISLYLQENRILPNIEDFDPHPFENELGAQIVCGCEATY